MQNDETSISERKVTDTSCEDTLTREISNTPLIWMHLTVWFVHPLVTLIIWLFIRNKHPQANVHGKNIL